MGFVSYYRRFIPNFLKWLSPSTSYYRTWRELPVRKRNFRFIGDLNNKRPLRPCKGPESPVLACADFKAPFILHTDASGDRLGAVLYQVQEGKQSVIAYASRSLSRSERNYPVHKLEFLALKWAITDKFHEYLYGS